MLLKKPLLKKITALGDFSAFASLCVSFLIAFSSFCSIDHQPLYLRHSAATGQYLSQKVGRQEVAQHGQPQLHQEELQTLAGGQKHAGDCEKGTV